MRFLLPILFLVALATLAIAWTKEDHELFRVRDELNTLEGGETNFFEFLGVKPSASLDEINKQHKKRSRQLHPDKAIPALVAKRSAPPPRNPKDNKGKKPGVTVTKGLSQKERDAIATEATQRYQLYSVVVEILRSPQRERYKYFVENGFPTWRGTGYYFKRYRPGLGTVLVGLLIVFGGAAHYGAMYVGYQRQRKFITKLVSEARTSAWGNATGVPGIPGMAVGRTIDTPPPGLQDDSDAGPGPMAMNRRQKRAQEKEDKKKKENLTPRTARAARDRNISRPIDGQPISGPPGTKKRFEAQNGKILVVDSVGNVYLEETTEEGDVQEFLLDPDDIPKPTILQTALFRLPIFAYKQTIGRAIDSFRGTSGSEEEPLLDDEGAQLTESAVSLDQNGSMGAATAMNANQDARNRKARARGENVR